MPALIGVTSGGEKAVLALSHGYDAVIDHKTERVPERVKALTGGKGVAVAFDSVGKDSFEDTIASLAPRGFFVTFGAEPPAHRPPLRRRCSQATDLSIIPGRRLRPTSPRATIW